jgi:hypothetical protein
VALQRVVECEEDLQKPTVHTTNKSIFFLSLSFEQIKSENVNTHLIHSYYYYYYYYVSVIIITYSKGRLVPTMKPLKLSFVLSFRRMDEIRLFTATRAAAAFKVKEESSFP